MLDQTQRDAMLRAMGYRPLRLRGTTAPADPTAPTVDIQGTEQAPASRTAPSPRAPQPTDHDPLWQSLLRAVHATAEQADLLGWQATLEGPAYRYDGPRLLLNLIALRGNAGAKRALWKTLRELRRRRQSGR